VFLSSCINSNTKTKSNSVISTGYLVDANVSGVEYICNDITGFTNMDGSFEFNYECDYITFKIGSLILAEMSTSKVRNDNIFYIGDIAQKDARYDTNNTSVKNITRILQTLDDDKNPENGINITSIIRDNITNNIPAHLSSENINESDLENIIMDANLSKDDLVSPIKALVHYEQTLRDNNILVDTVPPYKPYLDEDIYAISNDFAFININGEKNTNIYLNGIDTNLTLDSSGFHKDFKLITNGETDKLYDYNITLKDTSSFSENLSLRIFKDTVDPKYTFSNPSAITSPDTNVTTIVATDNSLNEPYNLSLTYEISGTHANLFEIDSNGLLTFKNSSVAGTYNINIEVSDLADHSIDGDIIITVN